MKKKVIMLLSLIFLFLICTSVAANEVIEPDSIIEDQLQNLNLGELEEVVNDLNRDAGHYLPELEVRNIIDLFRQEGISGMPAEIMRGLVHYLFDEIVANSTLLGQLIILAMIVAILKSFQGNFAGQEVSKLANGIVYLVLVIVALNSFKVAVATGTEAITNMVDIMQAILPLLLSLLVSMGNVTSAALFHPISFLIVSVLSTLVRNIVFPLIFLATILDIVNNISDEFEVTGLAGLFKQLSMGVLGVIMTIFMAAIVTQGTIGTVSDGVTIRTAKYLTGTFVPIVGGYLASALDMIIGGSLLIKNALGVFSVIIVLIFCSLSVVKIIAMAFIYRLASAIIQPVSDQKIVNCLDKLANSLLLIFASVAAVGLMFFVVIIILVGVANFSVMMR
ncbi:stage III sporulation protein AE [Natroniella acetigena]|uniref:stage III sporulation protein AE n=1 Tax=Natroniella acetigena TaxID=52004 RepID=UPI00200B2923|nr:stage III sporulation protein AE [Natroniella acetigena]MCK8826636.1 stage III sporulation protein AE [Natroniella acetigena]